MVQISEINNKKIIKVKCPKILNKDGKKEWKRVIKIFEEENKKFTDQDIKALERYCSSYSDILKFSKLLEETGYLIYSTSGYPQQHPYCQLKKNAEQEMRNWMKELGLTPAARARMNKNKFISVGDNYSKEDKDMEKLFND
ncbi:phage terminase small subunit P27 family [Eubacterium multiforme]|uniref:P27 family predicted phage terminase small subunit n=1 Tax=Eubacterium multiforme TaxID=83339 RepID=A0ABT9USD0_9FIRM|nr:phage terminase small subunit P27 family [Eubacterium multiforme]MDQ0149223.1 P27 family predicted phage terminase small subunit [Eubacterium multiforme]